MPSVEILSQGDEVVTGQIADMNGAWLSEQLTSMGFSVLGHRTVGDHSDHIEQALLDIAERADVCICTGGLGPTEDDLTRHAVSKAFSKPLVLSDTALTTIKNRFMSYHKAMPETNVVQAWFPKDATILENAHGTAPGFSLHHASVLWVFLPGPPREMKPMFAEHVEPILTQEFSLQHSPLITLRTAGIGESSLQERIGSFSHPSMVLSYRTILPENHIKLRFTPDASPEQKHAVTSEIAQRIGSPLFSIEGLEGTPIEDADPEGGDLAAVIGRALQHRQQTLSVAESCTGGRVASLCTAVAGASQWFLESVTTYTNDAKIRRLGVRPDTLSQYGAVSREVVLEMASGMCNHAQSTYGLATTGIAGPEGGTENKPVGTVHFALATPQSIFHREFRFPGNRSRVQTMAAATSLDLLRRFLQNKLNHQESPHV